MSIPSRITPRPPERPKRAPWRIAIVLWTIAAAQLIVEFQFGPASAAAERLLDTITFILVGAGLCSLTTTLVQRRTCDPYTDFLASLEQLHAAGYRQGYDRGYRDGHQPGDEEAPPK